MALKEESYYLLNSKAFNLLLFIVTLSRAVKPKIKQFYTNKNINKKIYVILLHNISNLF